VAPSRAGCPADAVKLQVKTDSKKNENPSPPVDPAAPPTPSPLPRPRRVSCEQVKGIRLINRLIDDVFVLSPRAFRVRQFSSQVQERPYFELREGRGTPTPSSLGDTNVASRRWGGSTYFCKSSRFANGMLHWVKVPQGGRYMEYRNFPLDPCL